ncbi:MAG: hypothetical protein AB9861_14685 [Methanosarcina sp.]
MKRRIEVQKILEKIFFTAPLRSQHSEIGIKARYAFISTSNLRGAVFIKQNPTQVS